MKNFTLAAKWFALLAIASGIPLFLGTARAQALHPSAGVIAWQSAFEANRGQLPRAYALQARTAHYHLLMAATHWLLLPNAAAGRLLPSQRPTRFAWLNARDHARILPGRRLPGIYNYLIGRQPEQWILGVPRYSQALVPHLYRGVALVYYYRQKQLEFNLTLQPGVRLSRIRFQLGGAARIRLDRHGDLRVGSGSQGLRLQRPIAYQWKRGRRQRIAAGYLPLGRNSYGFWLGHYDPRLPVILDPVLAYATYLGGSGQDTGAAIATDSGGNIYVVGQTNSANFPVTAGAFQSSLSSGQVAAYIAKLNAGGTALDYATFIGGNGQTDALGVAVDSSGAVYMAGMTSATNFPVTAGAVQTTYGGGAFDAFALKLDSAGSGLVYATYLGGAGDDVANAIAINAAGDAWIAGGTDSSDFPVTSGALQTHAPGGGGDGFIAEVNASGTGLAYSTFLGGSAQDFIYALAVDANGDAFVTGTTTSTDFPTTPGAYQPTFAASASGMGDGFVAELVPSGAALVYSTYLGPASAGYGIALDAQDDAYVTGDTQSAAFPVTPGAAQASYAGNGDAFVAELAASGATLEYSSYLGGAGDDIGAAIAIDGAGNAYVAGQTTSTNFPISGPAPMSACAGSPCGDAFVTEIAAGGKSFPFSTYLGGSGSQQIAHGVTIDPNGDIDVVGTTNASDFPVTAGAFQTAYGGGGDAFIAQLAIPSGGLTLSPGAISFAAQPVGSSSAAKTLTLANSGSSSITIASITATAPFAATSQCGSSLASGASCTVQVSFTPTASGAATGTLTIASSAANSPQTAALTGQGSDFSIAVLPTSASVTPGTTAQSTATITALDGFSSSIALTCTSTAPQATCSVSPATVTPTAAGVTAQLSLSTTASSRLLFSPGRPDPGAWGYGFLSFWGILLSLVLLLGWMGRRSARWTTVIALLGLSLSLAACGGGSTPAPPASHPGTATGTYTVTLTGTAQSLSHSATFSVTVN